MVNRARHYGPELRKADCFPLTILNLQILSTLLVPQCGGTAIVMDRVDPVGIAEWIDQERATTLERRAGHAVRTGQQRRRPGDLPAHAARRVERRQLLPAGDQGPLPGQVRPTGVLHLRPDRSTDGGDHRPARRGGRGTPRAGCRSPIWPCISSTTRARPRRPATSAKSASAPRTTPELASLYRPMLGLLAQSRGKRHDRPTGASCTPGTWDSSTPMGYLHVQDRHQSFILRGGANVYPAEVERVINEFPGIAGQLRRRSPRRPSRRPRRRRDRAGGTGDRAR